MKKFIFVLILDLISICAFGQEKFVSELLDNQFNILLSIKEKNENNNKKWAEALAKEFSPDDNGSLNFEYIITYPDSLSIESIMDKTVEWTNYKFKSNNAIQNISRDSGSESIFIHGNLEVLSQQTVMAIYYAKKSYIKAEIDIIIKFKEGRLKINSIIRHYTYISGDSMLVAKNILINPNSIYPFGENNDIKGLGDKNACSLALINAMANVIGICDEYKEYLNKEFNKVSTFEDKEDW